MVVATDASGGKGDGGGVGVVAAIVVGGGDRGKRRGAVATIIVRSGERRNAKRGTRFADTASKRKARPPNSWLATPFSAENL